MQKISPLDFLKQESYFPRYATGDVAPNHCSLKLVCKLHKLPVWVVYFSYSLNSPSNIVNERDIIPENGFQLIFHYFFCNESKFTCCLLMSGKRASSSGNISLN